VLFLDEFGIGYKRLEVSSHLIDDLNANLIRNRAIAVLFHDIN
jgi:hypothetical protein